MFLLKIPERLIYASFLVNPSPYFSPLFQFAFFLPVIFIFLNCSSVPFFRRIFKEEFKSSVDD
ncbi:hypothetical protein DLM78_04815 [Leptospira stimsonii]|nr:hypothetical protein DLM78_04815 [Leptospira stimsonii]